MMDSESNSKGGKISQEVPSPVTEIVRRSKSVVRRISQVVLRLSKDSDNTVFRNTRHIVLKWISEKAGRDQPLPDEAWEGESFTTRDEFDTQLAEAVSIKIEGIHYWGARLDDADDTVARRIWPTEVAIEDANDGYILFGARLQCVTHGKDRPFFPSIPNLVRNVISAQTAYLDGRVISVDPWIVDSEDKVDELYSLLTNPNRRSEVFVFSAKGSIDPDTTVASAKNVAKCTAGVAHTAIISGQASYLLSDRLGKEFSVYDGGVRTYRPGFDPDIDKLFDHPLALPSRIVEWGDEGPTAFEKFLISQALERSISGRDIEQQFPSFAKIRRFSSEQNRRAQRDAGSTDQDLLALAEEEIAKLTNENEEIQGLLDRAVEEKDQVSQEAWSLRVRIDTLLEELKKSGHSNDRKIPNDLKGFEKWCAAHISDSVKIHPRALQGVKKSSYKDPSLIYKALLLLHDYYVPMRLEGGDELKKAFEKERDKLRIKESPSGSETSQGEKGKNYMVEYPPGRERRLDRHLTKGSAHDPRHCFRLYFFWDEDSGNVVVGWLPSHLPNKMT